MLPAKRNSKTIILCLHNGFQALIILVEGFDEGGLLGGYQSFNKYQE